MIWPLKWMPAYSVGGSLNPVGVVVHCTESDNGPGSAEAVAGPGWFGGPAAGTSAHKVVDRDSIIEGVHRNTVAWHVGPAGNGYFIGYEFCGRASWTAAQWNAPEQLNMIRGAAPYIAADLKAMGAPARWLSLTQVAQKQKGLLSHNDVRLALGGTTHSDPGPNFPYGFLLSEVNKYMGNAPAPQPSGSFPYPHTDCFGLISDPSNHVHGGINAQEKVWVKQIQVRLQQLGYAPSGAGWADGVYEQATADAVAKFQHARMPGTTKFGEVWFDDWAVLFAAAPKPPAPKPPAPPSVPAFPFPHDHCFGLITDPSAKVHGGINAQEQAWVKLIQQALIRKGFVPGQTNPNSGWADGKYEMATAEAVSRFQRAKEPGTTIFGQVWFDDWAHLLA